MNYFISLVSLYRENNNDVDDDDDDEVIDYELNRYPILLDSVNNPFDNLQLQQRYNTDDLPLDDGIEESLNDDGDSDEMQYRSFYENQYPYYVRMTRCSVNYALILSRLDTFRIFGHIFRIKSVSDCISLLLVTTFAFFSRHSRLINGYNITKIKTI